MIEADLVAIVKPDGDVQLGENAATEPTRQSMECSRAPALHGVQPRLVRTCCRLTLHLGVQKSGAGCSSAR